ncbi:acetaldehyde dehydrogenase (acetylating) [Rhizobium sp. P38BS-XIX]|uniref:acetaldehyde dehydrogenase (acetylating) n=1 Tax=Rhizobium sp. P38BS-XIX TaxID=2726740 RepID=UPI00145641E3|nr:acetaldehyde dehydrogenase (acetylating) [Rhizobium sp. P38BS-XIX]NLS00724.1 acetaldehyde dehydrogenase (acetylating) [Rhizobium sp. P38BS-XIX]
MSVKVAIIGSGNIGTDLMIKILRRKDGPLVMAVMVGVDPQSDGLARARNLGVAVTSDGLEGLRRMDVYQEIGLVFDATSAGAHKAHAAILKADGKCAIDLTPAALGPYVVPSVNMADMKGVPNVNMVTCGGQATIPIVAALSRVAAVSYAEIVASIASRSAGPGTRANIDEFTETTSRAIESVGGARRGKAIIILNPAEPPLVMRDTVYCLVHSTDHDALRRSIHAMVAEVQSYVPGYRLKQDIQFEPIKAEELGSLAASLGFSNEVATKVTVFLEVEGAAHYLPAYAGNLDIMTAAALRAAQQLVMTREGIAA